MATQEQTYGMAGSGAFATAQRWLKVWVGLGAIAVVITCLFLIAIITALKAIDKSLSVTDPTVTDIKGVTDPLPGHISTINKSLTDIDVALKPIPARADTIIGILTSIDRSAGAVDPSLANTSSILVTGLGQLGVIDDTLEQADDIGTDNRGVKLIIDQANIINPLLVTGEKDTTDIDVDLNKANGAAAHVFRICTNTLGTRCNLNPPSGRPGA
jgi:hypothetical protein